MPYKGHKSVTITDEAKSKLEKIVTIKKAKSESSVISDLIDKEFMFLTAFGKRRLERIVKK